MAAIRLPHPGKIVRREEIGPCVDEDCGHTDCIQTRRMANRHCPVCGLIIGYEIPFYGIGDQLIHAACYTDPKPYRFDSRLPVNLSQA